MQNSCRFGVELPYNVADVFLKPPRAVLFVPVDATGQRHPALAPRTGCDGRTLEGHWRGFCDL